MLEYTPVNLLVSYTIKGSKRATVSICSKSTVNLQNYSSEFQLASFFCCLQYCSKRKKIHCSMDSGNEAISCNLTTLCFRHIQCT